jgi:uncharacterized protein (TIGR02444 family)
MIPPADASPFWRFSLDVYARPGVAEACLDLQDACGADVNILLFLLWRAADADALPAAAVAQLDAAVREWRANVVVPLRTLRRRLKRGVPPIPREAAEPFRTGVKAMELTAERLQQDAMSGMAESLPARRAGSPSEAARLSLAAYAELLGRTLPPGGVDALTGALPDVAVRPQ